jgi:hypothetical protein
VSLATAVQLSFLLLLLLLLQVPTARHSGIMQRYLHPLDMAPSIVHRDQLLFYYIQLLQ